MTRSIGLVGVFLIAAITHQTDAKEREEILSRFNEGIYPCLVTSRVLNEGVNVPDVNMRIILSGTGDVREHVQRLRAGESAKAARQTRNPLRDRHRQHGRTIRQRTAART